MQTSVRLGKLPTKRETLLFMSRIFTGIVNAANFKAGKCVKDILSVSGCVNLVLAVNFSLLKLV
jgi:hypothetical protein